MNLYELTAELAKIDAALKGAETDEEIFSAVLELREEREQKLENILRLRKNFEMLQGAASGEIKKLREREAWAERRIAALDNWVGANLLPGERFECGVGGYSWRKSEVCEPDETNPAGEAPEVYTKLIPKPEIAKIKEDLKMGAKVPGWRLRQKNNLQIR